MKNIVLLFIFTFIVSCTVKEPYKPIEMLDKGTDISLQESNFSQLKNFENDNLEEIVSALNKTCQSIKQVPSTLLRAKININPTSYINACKKFDNIKEPTSDNIRTFLTENFTPYLVKKGTNPQGKFTSYYEAELKASKTRHDEYIHPIYNRPNDLIEINLTDFDRSLPNRNLMGRIENSKLIPYYTRAEIENKGIDAPVILWGNDPVDIFLMQIQGSAVALLDDNTSVRVSYSDNNGHAFVGIGSILLKKGLLKPGQASMDKIRDWLKDNPQIAKTNMAENPRYIFHRISNADGPVGALGVSLTAGRSLAVDNSVIPLGALLWLETTGPKKEKIEKLVIAQDIGGAIKGVVRGDYFWGHGEEALLSAGKMNSAGQYYILIPKNN